MRNSEYCADDWNDADEDRGRKKGKRFRNERRATRNDKSWSALNETHREDDYFEKNEGY